MSEYQYNEFHAIDRPLTAKDMSVRHGSRPHSRVNADRQDVALGG